MKGNPQYQTNFDMFIATDLAFRCKLSIHLSLPAQLGPVYNLGNRNILALALEFKKLHSYLRNGQYLSKMQLKERSLRYSI